MIASHTLSQPHNAQGKTLTNFNDCELNGMALAMTALAKLTITGQSPHGDYI